MLKGESPRSGSARAGRSGLLALLALLVVQGAAPLQAQRNFRRGDATADGIVDFADPVKIGRFLFAGGELDCEDAADTNDDGTLNLSDVAVLLNFLGLASPALLPPPGVVSCGPDPTADPLDCAFYPESGCKSPRAPPENEAFLLSFELPPGPVEGAPGGMITVEDILVVLENAQPVEGWSLSLGFEGCEPAGATTAGTRGALRVEGPPGLREDTGFERTELIDPARDDQGPGIVSAVILSAVTPVFLAPDAPPHPLLRLSLTAKVPPVPGGTADCFLRFSDGLRGAGQPVSNRLVAGEQSVNPERSSGQLLIRAAGAARPSAAITGPSTLLFLEPGPVSAVFDGRGSRDHLGGELLRYAWSSPDPGVEIAQPAAALTEVFFPAPGAYTIELEVRSGPGFTLSDTTSKEAAVRRPEELPRGPPEFAPRPPEPETPFALRTLRFRVVLAAGNPPPLLRLEGPVPEGLTLDPPGVIEWEPSLGQVGEHLVSVVAENAIGAARKDFLIRALDPIEPTAAYALAAGEGGGAAELLPPPAKLKDGSPFLPKLDLILDLPEGFDQAIRLIDPDPKDPPAAKPGLRFQPVAGGAQRKPDGTFGGAYRSGGSAAKFIAAVLEKHDFTVELWVSAVSDEQPGEFQGNPAVLFTLESPQAGSAFAFAKEDGGDVLVSVRVDPEAPRLVEMRLPAPELAAPEPHQLVLVGRQGSLALYLDGALREEIAQDGDLAWPRDAELLLGNDVDLKRPITGDIHLAAVYAEALSASAVRALHRLGPDPLAQPEPPLLFICPDPEVVARGIKRIEARAEAFGGEGGGAGFLPSDIRSFTWRIVGSGPPDVRTESATEVPVPGESAVLLHYDPDRRRREPVRLEVEVKQAPLRGKEAFSTEAVDVPVGPVTRRFARGDCDGDGVFHQFATVTDMIFLLTYLFRTDPEKIPPCFAACDFDGSGGLEITDVVAMSEWLFQGLRADADVPQPFKQCGWSEREEDLRAGCEADHRACTE